MSETETDSVPPLALPSRLLAGLIVAFALFLRLLWLGMKPPHFDEGVNGWFVDQMTTQGYYQYDPSNYHGPFHFYVLFLAQTLFGRSIEVMRLPLVLVNTATVWLLLQFRRFIPWRACVFAALAFAVSPGMLFYSRYAIHEAWLVFGMILAVWGAAEMWVRGTVRGLWAAALGATLMILNKETHIIHFAAFGLAVATLAGLELLSPSSPDSKVPARPVVQRWSWVTLGNAFAVSLLLLVFFYSGGFLDPTTDPDAILPADAPLTLHAVYARWSRLILNFFQAFAVWSKTGVQGTDHSKAWSYWLQLILRYEWPVLLGLLWSVRALWPGMNRLTRWVAIYGCGALVAYSIVHYKTPWCIISIIWPFFFLFGSGVDSAMRFFENRGCGKAVVWLPAVTALAIVGASLSSSVDLNYRHPTEEHLWTLRDLDSVNWLHTQALTDWINDLNQPTEPDSKPDLLHVMEKPVAKWLDSISLPSYIYVQTTNDYFKLTRPLNALIAKDPTAVHMVGNILLSSYHPLPWVLGDFTHVGYYEKEPPPTMDAGFIIADEDRVAQVEAALKESYFVFPFKLRDGMDKGKLYLNAARFAPVFTNHQPEFVPQANPTP